jgi:hypothetical protein
VNRVRPRLGVVAGLLAGLLIVPAPPARALDFDGYLQESIGGRTAEPDDVIFHRQTLNLKLQERRGRKFLFRLETDLWFDNADFMDDTPRESSRIRELYVKFGVGDLDLRLGRVQIAWGEAEGVIISDQVSPFDLQNFIIPKFDEIRLGVDGVFADYYFQNGNELQLLWIMHFEPNDFPDDNSPWSFIDRDAFEAAGLDVLDTDEPANQLENSELGARFSGHPLAADWSVGYLWSYDDRPSLFFRPCIPPAPCSQSTVTPTIERFHLFTGNVVAPVGDYLIKFDTAYEKGRWLSLDPSRLSIPGGITPQLLADGLRRQSDVWKGLIGLEMKPDVRYWEQAEASFQFVHEHVFDDHPALTQAQDSDLFSMRLTAAYLNEKVKPWLFTIYNLQGDSFWMQAKVDWEPRDAVKLTIEYDLFAGHAYDGHNGGVYGMYDDNDMVQLSARYTF